MRPVLIATIALMICGLAIPPAAAETADCRPNDYVVVDVNGLVYIDTREILTQKYVYNVWIYIETGVNNGLVRGDIYAEVSGDTDFQCGTTQAPPDADDVIF